jgi:hypothetical protein
LKEAERKKCACVLCKSTQLSCCICLSLCLLPQDQPWEGERGRPKHSVHLVHIAGTSKATFPNLAWAQCLHSPLTLGRILAQCLSASCWQTCSKGQSPFLATTNLCW